MPLNSTGRKVKKEMEERYGKERGERIFYSTENKKKKFRNAMTGHKAKATWWADRLYRLPPAIKSKVLKTLSEFNYMSHYIK